MHFSNIIFSFFLIEFFWLSEYNYLISVPNRCLLIESSGQMDGSSRPRIESNSEDSSDDKKVPTSALTPAQTTDMLKYKFDNQFIVVLESIV